MEITGLPGEFMQPAYLDRPPPIHSNHTGKEDASLPAVMGRQTDQQRIKRPNLTTARSSCAEEQSVSTIDQWPRGKNFSLYFKDRRITSKGGGWSRQDVEFSIRVSKTFDDYINQVNLF